MDARKDYQCEDFVERKGSERWGGLKRGSIERYRWGECRVLWDSPCTTRDDGAIGSLRKSSCSFLGV